MGFFDKINNNTVVDTLKQLRNRRDCIHPVEAALQTLPRQVLNLSTIKDERLSRPEPTPANDLPRVASEVTAIPGVSYG